MDKPAVADKRHTGRRVVILAGLWLAAYFAARGILENAGIASWARALIALIPVPIFAGFLRAYVGLIRSMDELERKIHVEALAIAFSLGLLLLTTLALMQRAVTLSFEDWSYAHVWVFFPIFYFGAIGILSSRYQGE